MHHIAPSVSPTIALLYAFLVGMAISIAVAFVAAKLVRAPDLSTRRAVFYFVGFGGFVLSWYIVFYVMRR